MVLNMVAVGVWFPWSGMLFACKSKAPVSLPLMPFGKFQNAWYFPDFPTPIGLRVHLDSNESLLGVLYSAASPPSDGGLQMCIQNYGTCFFLFWKVIALTGCVSLEEEMVWENLTSLWLAPLAKATFPKDDFYQRDLLQRSGKERFWWKCKSKIPNVGCFQMGHRGSTATLLSIMDPHRTISEWGGLGRGRNPLVSLGRRERGAKKESGMLRGRGRRGEEEKEEWKDRGTICTYPGHSTIS